MEGVSFTMFGTVVRNLEFWSSIFISSKELHRIATSRIEIFGQTTIDSFLSYEYQIFGVSNKPNIFASTWSCVTAKYNIAYYPYTSN